MSIRYAELHTVSNYSFLCGASHPEELVQRAHELGYSAIALTDECTYAGLVKAHMTAKEYGIKLIVGAEFSVNVTFKAGANAGVNEAYQSVKLILLATNRPTYGQIAALISKLRRRSEKGTYSADLEDFRWGLKGCLALWAMPVGKIERLIPVATALQEVFPELWIALELFRDGFDLDKMANALTISMRLDIPITASNDVHTHVPARQPLQDLLTAVRERTTVGELGSRAFSNAERTLRPLETLASLYPSEFLSETMRIADRCQFSMDELRYEYPEDLVPPHLTPSEYLRQLTYAGAQERWPEGISDDTRAIIERELDLIGELSYEYYFLTVQDIVQFARSQNILCHRHKDSKS